MTTVNKNINEENNWKHSEDDSDLNSSFTSSSDSLDLQSIRSRFDSRNINYEFKSDSETSEKSSPLSIEEKSVNGDSNDASVISDSEGKSDLHDTQKRNKENHKLEMKEDKSKGKFQEASSSKINSENGLKSIKKNKRKVKYDFSSSEDEIEKKKDKTNVKSSEKSDDSNSDEKVNSLSKNNNKVTKNSSLNDKKIEPNKDTEIQSPESNSNVNIDDNKEKNGKVNDSVPSENNTSCIIISDSSDGEKDKKPVYLKLRSDLFYSDSLEKNKSLPNDSQKTSEASLKKEVIENGDIEEISSDSNSDTLSSKKKQTDVKSKDKKCSESSESDDFVKINKKKCKKDLGKKKLKGKVKNKIIDSDSNSSKSEKDDDFELNSSDSSSSDSEEENKKKNKLKKRSRKSSKSSDSDDKKMTKSKKRKRIRKMKESSNSDSGSDKNTRKHIKKILTKDSLQESTLAAAKAEKERKARIAERQKKYNQIFDADLLKKAKVEKVILDFDAETNKELLSVDTTLAVKLKPHQAEGVKFMWDSCFESLERLKKNKSGSGCILAHCMGLGKTLQVVAFIHTLLNNQKKTNVSKVLVVCPINTVLNWVNEFEKWLFDVDGEIDIYEMVKAKSNVDRECAVRNWSEDGGVMVIGYNMFRILTNETNKRVPKRLRNLYQTAFVDPGPDLVVCDEGHLLKNEKTNLSIAMNKIKTPKRIVLTGTPMQNNLKEYYCMVQFVKPDLLGTYKEYLNRFVNPITNGQYTDSTPFDIAIMKRRSHVLHSLLDGVIQRKDYAVLAPFLPPKFEYVLFIVLSDMQIKLYDYYLKNKTSLYNTGKTGASLFNDFQSFQRICTHPRVLKEKSIEERNKQTFLEDDEDSEGSLKDFIDDGNRSDSKSESNSDRGSSSEDDAPISRKRVTRGAVAAGVVELPYVEEKQDEFSKEWWYPLIEEEQLDQIELSSKIFLLFTIIQQCESIGDKILVFSQSLYSLNVIEYFLSKIDEATQNGSEKSVCGFSGSWSLGLDYFRIDGSSSCDSRQAWCDNFNDPENTRARLFLISTKAGGLGINLVAANRVVIFDVSWNPSHDTQSIYRVYRFGQTKPCYIYRFVCQGTMEMKIYERQVTKQAISKRVVDEQQIDRHYTQNDLTELYKFEPKPSGERPIPLVPKDVLLGELLQNQAHIIYQYHEHQSLLENKEDEELNEAERKAAWDEFENEKVLRQKQQQQQQFQINQIPMSSIYLGVSLLVKKDNPTWNEQQIRNVIPAVVKELQDQVTSGNNFLYSRVIAEIQNYQIRKQQQQQQQLLLQQMYMQQSWGQQLASVLGNPNVAGPATFDTPDIIELND